jgi:fusicocca-2,10(14)-diene synthase
MDLRFSDIIDPSTYETDGLCDGIDLRRHKDPMGENIGAIRCQKDWSKLISAARNYKGTLGHPFSFIRVTVPECLPERLEIISYANEYAFLYDGRHLFWFTREP